MKRIIALMAVVALCMTFGMGCKKMPAGLEDAPEAQIATTPPPPPPPPPAVPAKPAEPAN